MEDKEIINLFWKRSENAIHETAKKYGNYCHYIAYGILHNYEDAEECVNDTYYKAWETIPPQSPQKLSVFLGKITRNLALNKWEYYNAEKRGKGQVSIVLEELHECIPTSDNVEQVIDDLHFEQVFNAFLASLSKEKRMVFMRRYWYFSSIKEIARDFHMGEGKVKMLLLRLRKEFCIFLEKEGISL